MVFKHVETILTFTFNSDTGTDDFRETVDIEGFDTCAFFDLFTHGGCPGFGAEDTDFDGQFFEVDTHLLSFFNEKSEVARSTAHGSGAEVFHKHYLTVGIADGGRNGYSSESFGSVMGAETAGEKSVTVRDLNDIFIAETAAHERTCDYFVPDFDIVLIVTDDDGFAGGTAGSVYADDFAFGDGEKTEGVIVAQVGFDGEGEFFDIIERFDIVRGN